MIFAHGRLNWSTLLAKGIVTDLTKNQTSNFQPKGHYLLRYSIRINVLILVKI